MIEREQVMQPEISQSNRLLQFIRLFFLGRQDRMHLPALRWWNHRRLGYNLRLIGCLLIGQSLLLSSGYSEGLLTFDEFVRRLNVWLYSDLLLLALFNLLYFLLPWLETSVFKGRPDRFRAYGYTFINTISALFVLFAIFAVAIMK